MTRLPYFPIRRGQWRATVARTHNRRKGDSGVSRTLWASVIGKSQCSHPLMSAPLRKCKTFNR